MELFQFPITALREIKILQLLKHENVVNLIEICRTKGMIKKILIFLMILLKVFVIWPLELSALFCLASFSLFIF